jgi:hypothetical protein
MSRPVESLLQAARLVDTKVPTRYPFMELLLEVTLGLAVVLEVLQTLGKLDGITDTALHL